MTINIIKGGVCCASIESNNLPRIGDTLMGLGVTDVRWNSDLSGCGVYIGNLLNWLVIESDGVRHYVGLDSMPVAGDYVEIPDRYLVEKCVISEHETVCFAKRVL